MKLRLTTLPLALAFATLSIPEVALAQEEVCQPFSQDDLDEFVGAIEAKVGAFQFDAAAYNLDDIQKQMRCLDTVVKSSTIARIARIRSLLAFFSQDEDKAVRWGRAQQHANPDQPWPSTMERVPAYDEIWEFADDPTIGSGGAGVNHPKKGGVFLNGHFLEKPEYMAEVPAFIQVADKKGNILQAYWQDGAAFNADIISDVAADVAPPKWFKPEVAPTAGDDGGSSVADTDAGGGDTEAGGGDTDAGGGDTEAGGGDTDAGGGDTEAGGGDTEAGGGDTEAGGGDTEAGGGDTEAGGGDTEAGGGDVETPKEKEPKEKEPKEKKPKPQKSGPSIVLLGAGGGAAVLAGTSYILSSSAHAAVRRDAQAGAIASEEELRSRRSFVNTMAISSGALAVGAVGLGVTAFIDANGTTGLGLNVRW